MNDILNGGLLLCRLPKGIIGEETARILGSLIVARTWQAAIARATIPETQRKDATLYIDECHNFLTLPGSVDDMLAEARGFRLGLVLAHQNLAQLPTETAAAISANARSKIMFNVDPDDARHLAKHTKPELDEHDLAHLDIYHATARLLVGNRELPAFTFTTNQPIPDRRRGRHDPAGLRRRAHPLRRGTTHESGRPHRDATPPRPHQKLITTARTGPRREPRRGPRQGVFTTRTTNRAGPPSTVRPVTCPKPHRRRP